MRFTTPAALKALAIVATGTSAASLVAFLLTQPGRAIASVTTRYLRALLWFYRNGPDSYARSPHFKDKLHSKIHLYSLALVLHLWNKPHYRNGTFQEDMSKNLRNVAVPGTGVALSYFSRSKVAYVLFLVFIYPAVALVGALDLYRKSGTAVVKTFEQNLLRPNDWFSLWRLNCRMATFHSVRTGNKGYKLEDKWSFLCAAKEAGIPVSPSLHAPRIVCKHRNEEGGLGYKSFSNASHGGDWIIQEHLTNDPVKLGAMLPTNAPLSTFRVITGATPLDSTGSAYTTQALSCVFRAGRAGAATDHVCVLFNVDCATGKVTHGMINQHWYQLGLTKAVACPWGVYANDIDRHPDSHQQVVGKTFEDIEQILAVSVNAHKTLAPGVPIIGWDVAVTKSHGILLLEGNFSCNFFCADFDMDEYLHMLDRHIRNLMPARSGSVISAVQKEQATKESFFVSTTDSECTLAGLGKKIVRGKTTPAATVSVDVRLLGAHHAKEAPVETTMMGMQLK